jgi:uncharacterized protein
VTSTWEARPERPPEVPDGPGGPDAPAPAPRGEHAWPAWTAPVALVAAFVVAFVGALLAALVGAAFGAGFDPGDTPPGVLIGATVVQGLAFVGAGVLFARMTGPTSAHQFGLRPTSLWWSLLWILALYVGFVMFAAVWAQIVEVEEQTQLLEDLGADRNTLLLVLSMLLVCVSAPLVEELFFRGYFFPALRNGVGLWPAALITGAIFGIIHIGGSPVGALVPLGVLGFALCLLYHRTGSLYPCIAVHAVNNAIAFGALNDWTWQIPLLVVGSLVACFAIALAAARWWRGPSRPAAAPPAPGLA